MNQIHGKLSLPITEQFMAAVRKRIWGEFSKIFCCSQRQNTERDFPLLVLSILFLQQSLGIDYLRQLGGKKGNFHNRLTYQVNYIELKLCCMTDFCKKFLLEFEIRLLSDIQELALTDDCHMQRLLPIIILIIVMKAFVSRKLCADDNIWQEMNGLWLPSCEP
ncbi:MAG: hypothetical protein HQL86_09015 [Magnetococcales bacterium]|nr:hypothetical protein [Magnetococcales bacterium]